MRARRMMKNAAKQLKNIARNQQILEKQVIAIGYMYYSSMLMAALFLKMVALLKILKYLFKKKGKGIFSCKINIFKKMELL
mmetsp:Transcript_10724/g.17900  ORF Transcript_10724/g.17900 Transcript_10724/m.17900 type:complete len:81 (-) Transcript_10724:746-988(-)